MFTIHFSAGYIFLKFNGIWYILTVQDLRFLDLKAAGGMSETGEDPIMTLRRELRQELGIEVVDAVLVHEVTKRDHICYYFLVTNVSGLPALDEERKMTEKKAGKEGDSLHMRWVTLEEFSQRVYKGQRIAFEKAALMMARNRVFCMDNMKLLSCFSS